MNEEEKVPVSFKELGNADMYVEGLRFNNNGQQFVVFGEIDYSLYTARGFKSVGYGPGTDVAWSRQETYAVRIDHAVKIIKGGQDMGTFKVGYTFDTLFGGDLLAVKSEDSVVFFDWETQTVVSRIEITPIFVCRNKEGTKVGLRSEDGGYILKCDKQASANYVATLQNHTDEGLDGAFELEEESTELDVDDSSV